jgi:hypothetical protein
MSDPFDLPPERRLPEAVRVAARARIAAGLHAGGAPAWNSGVAPVAIAMAVAALAAAAVGVTAVHHSWSSAPAASTPRGNGSALSGNRFITPEERYGVLEGQAPADLAGRCAAAARREAPEGWRPLLTAFARGASVIVYRTPAGPRFCELTPATVTLSAPLPNASAAGTVRPTFTTAFGTVGGVIDPAFGKLMITAQDPSHIQTQAVVRDGIFVLPNEMPSHVGLALEPADSPKAQGRTVVIPANLMPAPARPTADRPQPPGDRTSAAGRRLAECFRRADGAPPVDPANWQPAATQALSDQESLQLGRYGDLLAVCRFDDPNAAEPVWLKVDDGTESDGYRDLEVAPNPFVATTTVFYGFQARADGSSTSDTVAVTGLTRSPEVATVRISRPTSPPVVATVRNGTFVLPGIHLNEGTYEQRQRTEITVLDAAGTVLARLAMPI